MSELEIPFGDDPFPKASIYRYLYEREIIHTPINKILDMAEGGRLHGRGLLDVCCGTGRLAIAAKENGAFPVCLDASPFLPDETEVESRRIPIVKRRMQDYLRSPDYEPFHIVACQNGIEYWIKDCTATDLSEAVCIGGVLLFNLPMSKPSTEPEEEVWVGLDGKPRVETIWLDGNTVRRTISTPDKTMFHRTCHPYVTLPEIQEILGNNYICKTYEDGRDELLVSCQRIR